MSTSASPPDSLSGLLDVLIVGAGLSGIGLAYYVHRDRPSTRYAIVEARDDLGGTWSLFRYPGIRSDSDLHSFGYEFKPWVHDKAIADGPDILAYLREAASENGITPQIHYQHKVIQADWQSREACWHVRIVRSDTGAVFVAKARWLFSAAGYYNTEQGFAPRFEGADDFKGPVIHPQAWPASLDYRDKRILVIGSGATAVTLIPALAQTAAHVTMLQRTPSYVLNVPSKDPIANGLRRLLPARWAYALTRRKNIALFRGIWRFCRAYPNAARRLIRYVNRKSLPAGYPVDTHFNPPYAPWDQRLCAVPDNDLFKAIGSGKASVVTDHIERFTEDGVLLRSGETLKADIIVTATGLTMRMFGGIDICKDGVTIDASKMVAFKGMMLSDLPNFAYAIGYTNAPWTLKIGLLCEHFCRLLAHMEQHRYAVCEAKLPSPDMPTRALLDFGAGYVQRSLSELPRQGVSAPWLMPMDYPSDLKRMRHGPVEDACLHFRAATDSAKA
jgi:monooxygenase